MASCASLASLAVLGSSAASGQVNVTTYHNDIGRTGQNLNETILNQTNVSPSTFGKLFSIPVDGQVYAQPLYMSGITINGATHNVIFVATENDSVYAFDADSNGGTNSSALWQASMLSAAHGAAAGATTVPSSMVGTDIQPQVGITGTPVIDPTTNTLYVVSAALENGKAVQRLHALDITTGNEKFGGPTIITASIPGVGNGSVNGTLTFDPLWQNQRGGLLLLNGVVYAGFASHGDNGPWHGWIFGFNAATLAQMGVYCTSPNGTGSGIWGAGAGLAADVVDPVNHPYGRMFIVTGNGDYTAASPYNNTMDYGESMLNLDLTNGQPTVTDEFTNLNQAHLTAEDLDQGSGGLVVLPPQITGNYPNLAVQTGKSGTLYLLNRDNMGGYNTTADQVVQEQQYAIGNVGAWSSPAFFNGNLYYWGSFDYLKSFPLANGQLSTTPTESSEEIAYPGSTPSISANGTSQGVVWDIETSAYPTGGPDILIAHSADNVSQTLYSSATNPSRDQAGPAVKFAVPTVVNGKVYVGAGREVDIYGLLAGVSQTQAPVISPTTESYSGSVVVTMTDATPNAIIYYTTDGSAPSANSNVYSGPITVTNTETITAIASSTGSLLSAQTTATFTNLSQTPAPSFSLPSGTYQSAQSLVLTDSNTSAVIYYTVDGSTPIVGQSNVYSASIPINYSETVTAIAVAPGLSASPAIVYTYNLASGTNGVTYNQGFAGSAGTMILNGSTDLDDARLQLTNGLSAEAGSAWYYTPQNIQSFTTNWTMQLSNAVADGMTFTIQNDHHNVNALGGNGSGLGYSGLQNSLAIKFNFYNSSGQGTDSTGLYTGGVTPSVPSIDLSKTGIVLNSDDTFAVQVVYNGTVLTMTINDIVTGATWSTSWTVNIPAIVGSNSAYVGFTGSTGNGAASQKVETWSFISNTASTTAAAPVFTPAPGIYSSTQTVTISDSTTGASIYYTTNGTAPSTSSTLYSAATPITVSSTETLNAIAVAPSYSNSPVTTATYTINLPAAATPTFSVAAGQYATAQTVTINDATPGTTVYYAINGTASASSTLYTGPITVAATETISAIAVATGYSNSSVATAAYTINGTAATPTFSVAPGTYTAAQIVSIADATAGSKIYYTTNGATPSTASAAYTGPITVAASETLSAIAVATGYSNSAVATAAYTINIPPPAATPTFSLLPGTYANAQTVTISDATPGTAIYFTTNGLVPTATASELYSGPVTVGTSETLNAIAVATGYSNSAVATAAYTIGSAVPTINYATGFTAAGMNLYGATVVNNALQLTDGGSGEVRVGWYKTPVNVQSFSTDFTFVLTSAAADGFTFTLQNAPAGYWAVGSAGGGLASGGLANSVTVKFDLYNNAGEGSDSTGFYLGGATPTVPSIDMTSSGVNLHSGDTMHAHITYDGTTLTLTLTDTVTGAVFTTASPINIPSVVGGNTAYAGFTGTTGSQTAIQNILAWTYTVGYTASSTATPTFSPVAGTYTSAQTVTISDATAGASIYYTTNGSTPTTSSTLYSASTPIIIGSSETLSAIAVAAGSTSAVGSAAYTINLPAAATPAFSVAPGTYAGAQTVSIVDTTAGAAIYYTTNGNVPTTASAAYTGPITVAASETISAIAVATGYANSAVATAAYTINGAAATPTFSVAPGTYAGAQTVSIVDTTPGAAIYYTTNGNVPTTASAAYTGPITVAASETISAIAVATGYTNSAVATAAYTINGAAATPTFSVAPGTYAGAQTVLIVDTTPGAAIYYTTNGNAPTTASAAYTGPITVAASETISAIAVATGYTNSAIATAAYTINIPAPAATPTFSVLPGAYPTAQTVSISDTTPGYAIYYTTNGATPTVTASELYSGPITVGASETLSAIAVATGYSNSAVASAAYTISTSTTPPTINYATGFTAAGMNLYGAAIVNNALEVTDGGSGEVRVGWYKTPVNVQSFSTDFTFLLTSAVADGFTFTLQNAPAGYWAVGAPGAGLASGGLANSVTVKFDIYNNSGEGSDSTGFYLGGATPTVPSIDMTSSGVNLHSGDTMHAHITYDGTTLILTLTDTVSGAVFTTASPINIPSVVGGNTAYAGFTGSTGGLSAVQNILTWTYTAGYTDPAAATPTFSVASGTYTAAQSVTISDTTPGSTIYYTTNGTAPTSASAVYSTPINVTASQTLNAIAVATGYTTSGVATATYSINLPAAAAPTFSVPAGAYASTQTIAISDTTAGSAIYYTTNGSTPTVTPSELYSGTPITIGATETLNAIAVANGYSSSAVATASYTINGPAATPTFSVAPGSYTSAQTVTISDATAGATIYYTTNGSTPTTASTQYSGAITVGTSETVQAIAVANGYLTSAPGTAAYTITLPVAATPTFSIAAGSYSSVQTVTLSDATAGATIYYTTNGTTPTASSTAYSPAVPITVSSSETLSAIAIANGYTPSLVGTAAYTINIPPTINYATGFTAAGMNLYGATVVNNALQLTDGGSGEVRVGWYKTPVNVQSFSTDFTFLLTSAAADGFTFTLQNAPAGYWAVGSAGAGLASGGLANSVTVKFDLYNNAGEGSDSTGFYLGGATPTVPSIDMTSSGVNLHSGDTMHAHITYDGTTLTLTLTDTVTGAVFTTASPINIPSAVGGNTAYAGFTGSTGGSSAVQNILTWTYTVN